MKNFQDVLALETKTYPQKQVLLKAPTKLSPEKAYRTSRPNAMSLVDQKDIGLLTAAAPNLSPSKTERDLRTAPTKASVFSKKPDNLVKRIY